MKKYKIKINYESEIEADSEEEAFEIFWELNLDDDEYRRVFLSDVIEIEEVDDLKSMVEKKTKNEEK